MKGTLIRNIYAEHLSYAEQNNTTYGDGPLRFIRCFHQILDGISTLAENHEWDVFQKNTVNCVFSSGENRKINGFRNGPSTGFVVFKGQSSPWSHGLAGNPWESHDGYSAEAALRAVLNGRSCGAVISVWFLVCVFLWRILTLYKTKADKDFSAH